MRASIERATLWDPAPRHVGVFRALQLGDLLCAVPAFRSLRVFVPHARITLIGLRWARDFVNRFHHYVDDFLEFPGFPGFPEHEASLEALLQFFAEARERRFDVALQLHGSGEFSNPLTQLMGAKQCAGFRVENAEPPLGPHYVVWPDDVPEVLRPLRLLQALGVPLQGTDLELPVSAQEWAQWRNIAERRRLSPSRYICIHPGARMLSRRWPLERFAAVGRALADDGWRVAVTGAKEEAELAAGLADAIGPGAVSIAGETSLGALAAVVHESALLICNDTGVSHVAAAMRARSVVIASGSDVGRWSPLDRDRHRVLAHDVPCRPCAHFACPIGHPCALGVTVDDVTAAARQLLQRTLRRAA